MTRRGYRSGRAAEGARGARGEEALARTVLERTLAVRPGERVTIESWTHALPWARALVLESRRIGATPTLVLEDEDAFFRSLGLGPSRSVPTAGAALAEVSDAYVYLGGPEAFPRLRGLGDRDLESIVVRHDPSWWRAARRGGLRAASLAIAGVTETAAARYGVDRDRWEREVLRASLVDPDRLARAADSIVRTLSLGHRIRIRHGNGTDLRLTTDRLPAILEDGRIDLADRRRGRIWTRLPSGLVAVPVALGTAEGTWESNRPVYDRFAEPSAAVGARFAFRHGALEEFSFERGGESFAGQYADGGPGREIPGALTFGLNPEIRLAPELGEVAAGAIGLLLGADRPRRNRGERSFSYLTTLVGADVDVDGEPWRSAGRSVRRRAT